MSSQDFGYRQELKRTMGGFSSFAVSFSLISVLTGIFANFNFGFREAGGWILWSWTLVAFGQYLIAKVMANLSVRFPIAGYGYQWTTRLVNPHFGFFIGWMLLIQFLTGFPGIAQTAALTLTSFAGWQLNESSITILTILIISLITYIHTRGIGLVARVNDLGVYAELLGILVLIGLIGWSVVGLMPEKISILFTGLNFETASEPRFSSMALSLLLGSWCLTGFEAAADLAEETQSPEKTVPVAVTRSLLSASFAGFLIIGLLVMAAGDIYVAQGKSNPLIAILEQTLGKVPTSIIMVFIIISIFACAVASMATASRLLFSMSRDNMFPFSSRLSYVNPKTRTPQSATIAVWGFSCSAVLIFRRIEVITSVSALASFIGYAGIMWACCREKFSLLPLTAFIWSLLVVAALAIPETNIPGLPSRHLPALAALTVLILGTLVYLFYVGPRIKSGKAGPPKV
ncbi:MAG: APC family permease [Bacteroidetes bacterium]|nr:APC family permease [Bacteroidota bacterium]MDA1122033.1 APC family permease [Bacteroidota bacterium]